MREIDISLTGKNSHHLKIDLGQGRISIGNFGMDKTKFDILVDPELPINWEALENAFPNYDNQVWTMFVDYYGDDLGFIKWANKTQLKQFCWYPNNSISANFSKSKINTLSITNKPDNYLDLILGKHAYLSLDGYLEKITIHKAKEILSLSFEPKNKNSDTYQLPIFSVFENNKDLSVMVKPIGSSFDCESLLQFKNLTNIKLYGNMTNLSALSKYEYLENLAIRYAPNLEGIPKLKSWEKLKSFIAWNVEETIGKKLRTELRNLKKEREFQFASVSKLRKKIWFTTEYGIPFAAWEDKYAKKAVKAYKTTLKNLNKQKHKAKIKEIIISFVNAFNNLDYIETSEREDIATAAYQLVQTAAIPIDLKEAQEWFNEYRDY